MLTISDFDGEYWIYFIVLLSVLAFIDRYAIAQNSSTIRKNFYSAMFWFTFSMIFCLFLKFLSFQNIIEEDHSMDFCTAYLIELSLSIDNVFVFIMIFEKLKISKEKQYLILKVGMISAVIMRLIMILFATQLIQRFTGIFYIFGFILIMSAIHIAMSSIVANHKYDVKKKKTPFYYKFFVSSKSHKLVRKVDDTFGSNRNKLALVLVEKADILFAIDSIPAVLSVTQDSFIVFTSNMLSIAFLRSLFFCVSHSMQSYQYLKYGIVLILCFIGVKLILLPQHILIPTTFSLGFILVVIVGSVLLSKIHKISHGKKST